MPKQARLSGIKALRCYTIDEAAAVAGVSARTVRNWISDGLFVMNETRPALIRGDDLRGYIKAKRSGRKVRISIDTFYCVRCRSEKRPAGGLADCVVGGGRATLSALCETCETVVSKPVAEARIPEIAQRLDLKITQHEATL